MPVSPWKAKGYVSSSATVSPTEVIVIFFAEAFEIRVTRRGVCLTVVSHCACPSRSWSERRFVVIVCTP